MPVEQILEDAQRKKSLRRLVVAILVGVILLHIVAGVIAAAFIVAQYFTPPPATFEVQRDLRIPAQTREHSMNMAALDSMAPKPSFNDKLQSLRPAEMSLPDLPKIPMDQMLPLDPSAIVSDQVSSLVGSAGTGGGGGGGTGGGGTGTGFTFLGVQTTAKRVLILYDIAQSVVTATERAGYPMDRIREETKQLLGALGINTRFSLGQFARNYAFFSAEMLPATDENRAQAAEWLDTWFAGTAGTMKPSTPNMVRGSPGFIEVMRAAFKLQPDVIFVISDGGFERGSAQSAAAVIPFPELQDALAALQVDRSEPVKIHFVGVGMKPNNEREMRRVIQRNGGGGKFRELK